MRRPIVLLLVVAFLLLSPALLAQAPTGMLSPTRPVIVDTNFNGVPDEADGTALPTVPDGAGNTTIVNPWSCGGSNNMLTMGGRDLTDNRFRTATRDAGTQMQSASIDQVSGNRAIHMRMSETPSGMIGDGGFVDSDTDGRYDRIQGTTPGYNIDMGMVFADTTGDGIGDYVSVPWAQSSMLGVNMSDGCGVGGRDPQIWVPLADTDGDGLGDSVVLDLNGDGNPDPDFLWGPVIGPAAATAFAPVPTMSTVGLIFLTIGIALVGAFVVRGGGSLGV